MIGAFPGNSAARLQAALQQAVQLLQARRWAAAERLLKPLQLEAGAHPDLLQLLGLAAKGQGDVARAEDLFRRSLRASRNQPAVWNNLGNVLYKQARWRAAAAAYAQAVALQPTYPDAWMNLASARAALEDHEAAIIACDRALTQTPGAMRALNRKGLSLMALAQFEDAEICLRAAVKAAPDAFEPRNNLGILLRERGKDAEAAEVYKAALRLRPDATDVKVGLAGAAHALGRFDEAERGLRAVLADAPAHQEALRTLVALLANAGRADEIPDAYEAILSAGAQQDGDIWQSYADKMCHMERYDTALEVLERARKACGDHPGFRLLQGRAKTALGQPQQALAELDIDPGWPGEMQRAYQVQRAQAYLRMGAYTEGAKELQHTAHEDPADYYALTYLEVLWRLAGDDRAAWLLDYQRFVQPVEIRVPDGYRDHADFNAALAEVLTALHVGSSHPEDQTLRGGTQTLGRLFQRTEPVIEALRTAIEEAVNAFIADLDHDPAHPFLRHAGRPWRFSGSWSVRLQDQGFHVPHFHPEGWISSAYYVALPESVADPETPDGRLQFGIPSVRTPDIVAPMREIRPSVGTLALFPSYCWHGTVPFRASDPRLTVAFDVAPVQAAGGSGK